MPGDDEETQWGVIPDDGFEIPLSEEEYEAYRKYRSDRDLIHADDQAPANEEVEP